MDGDDLFDVARRETDAMATEHAAAGAGVTQLVTVCLLDAGDGRSTVITTNVAASHTPPQSRAATGLELAEHAARWIREHPDEVFAHPVTGDAPAQADWPASAELLAD